MANGFMGLGLADLGQAQQRAGMAQNGLMQNDIARQMAAQQQGMMNQLLAQPNAQANYVPLRADVLTQEKLEAVMRKLHQQKSYVSYDDYTQSYKGITPPKPADSPYSVTAKRLATWKEDYSEYFVPPAVTNIEKLRAEVHQWTRRAA